MTDEQLLMEVDDILRSMPASQHLWEQNPTNLAWLGRASAVVEAWNRAQMLYWKPALRELWSDDGQKTGNAVNQIVMMLHQAQHDLRMKTVGPLNVAIGHGKVFDYFNEVREATELAKSDIFFIDPYLDAEFVSRYLPHVSSGVNVRLLAREKLKSLLPAVDAMRKQDAANIEVRSSPNFHDRFFIVDMAACYQSGASFKDGGKSAPTTLTQLTDTFQSVSATYEALWVNGKIEN